ncbi:MAG: four helix bundle protein [Victivallaceae bacterium]
MKTHKDLEVWKEGIDLVTSIYEVTKDFPHEEIYGLTSQMKRSAISVPSNIAEGAARGGKKEFIHFLYISLASLAELETQIIIAEKLKFTNASPILSNIEILRRKLLNFIKFQKQLLITPSTHNP